VYGTALRTLTQERITAPKDAVESNKQCPLRTSARASTLEALETAFNAAWQELEANDLVRVNAVSARKALAEPIIDLAREGHKDPATLQRLALGSLPLFARTAH
jgi:hypothetical protein